MDTLITILVLIVIFGLLVGLHEFGHFIAAKKQGVWVLEFGFGFGPTLFSKKIGDTVYKINLVPLGGYVKLFGERELSVSKGIRDEFNTLDKNAQDKILEVIETNQLSKIVLEDELRERILKIEGISQEEKDWVWAIEMNKKSRVNNPKRYSNMIWWRKLIVVYAGIFTNLLLGFIIYSLYLVLVRGEVFLPSITEYKFIGAKTDTAIGIYYAKEKATETGVEMLVKFDGETVGDVSELQGLIEENIGKTVELSFLSRGNIISKEVMLNDEAIARYLPMYFAYIKPALSVVEENSYAENLGLRKDDIILKVNDKSVTSQTISQVLKEVGDSVQVEYFREGEGIKTTEKIPFADEAERRLGVVQRPYFGSEKGVILIDLYHLDYGNSPFGGVSHSVNMIFYQVSVMSEMVKISFEKKDASIVSDVVSGPIAVGSEVNNLVKVKNLNDTVNLVALISLSLAMLNSLPLPLLDGGYLIVILYEGITKKKLPEKFMGIYNLIGIVIIGLLTISVTLKDIIGLFIK